MTILNFFISYLRLYTTFGRLSESFLPSVDVPSLFLRRASCSFSPVPCHNRPAYLNLEFFGFRSKVFKKAGAKESSVYPMKAAGAHPSATCRIGVVIDKNLETQIRDLYCCDASVFPSSLGAPVVWTVVSLGKRLSKHLDRKMK